MHYNARALGLSDLSKWRKFRPPPSLPFPPRGYCDLFHFIYKYLLKNSDAMRDKIIV